MKTLTTWIGDVYKNHGWLAALIIFVVVALLIVGIATYAGLDLAGVAGWLENR